MTEIPVTYLPCTRCGLMPPDPDPSWHGENAGTCRCWPDKETALALAEQAEERLVAAVNQVFSCGAHRTQRSAA